MAACRFELRVRRGIMEAKDVIERFCMIQRVAADHVGFEYAADCFCKQSGFCGENDYDGTFDKGYRNDGKALEFVEQAVREKIERDAANAMFRRPPDREPEQRVEL